MGRAENASAWLDIPDGALGDGLRPNCQDASR